MSDQEIPEQYLNHDFIQGETAKAILTKAIEKAVAGGWNGEDLNERDVQSDFDGFQGAYCSWPTIIFNHDFAKALWGDGNLTKAAAGLSDVNTDYLWQLRLQQMVIAEDPIKYLGDNI